MFWHYKPQGSIPGPILFLSYVEEFPQYIGNQNCNILADVAMIYSFGNDIIETESNLQSDLDALSPWYRANRLSINTDKSALIFVGKLFQVHDASISINVDDVPLEQVNVIEVLFLTAHCHGAINAMIFVPELLVKLQFCAD